MPTGYTALIEDGTTFAEWAMLCARNFGALIMMWDEPMLAPIPEEFRPSDRHAKRLAEERVRLEKVKSMTDLECETEAKAQYESGLAAAEKAIAERGELRARYVAMLAKVDAWQPPSADHVYMKEWMQKQIRDSIEFGCSTDFYTDNPPSLLSGAEWRQAEIADALLSIALHEKEHQGELDRTASRNLWIRQLRESLKGAQ